MPITSGSSDHTAAATSASPVNASGSHGEVTVYAAAMPRPSARPSYVIPNITFLFTITTTPPSGWLLRQCDLTLLVDWTAGTSSSAGLWLQDSHLDDIMRAVVSTRTSSRRSLISRAAAASRPTCTATSVWPPTASESSRKELSIHSCVSTWCAAMGTVPSLQRQASMCRQTTSHPGAADQVQPANCGSVPRCTKWAKKWGNGHRPSGD